MSDSSGTRERILLAAIEILETEGEVGIRVDRVVTMAGYTKPVLYHHFHDRDGLISAAQAERYRQSLSAANSALEQAMGQSSTVGEFFRALRAWIGLQSSDEGVSRRRMRAQVLGAAASRPDLAAQVVEVNRAQAGFLGGWIAVAQERGWVSREVDANQLAMWWIGVQFSRHLAEIDPDHYDASAWDAIAVTAMASFLVGLNVGAGSP